MQKLLLLGQDAPLLGQVVQRDVRSTCICLSAGSDPQSPAFAYKLSKDFPNEDGALALYDGRRWLLAVADGHMGHHVSHRLLQALADCSSIPGRLGQLSLWLSSEDLLTDQPGGSTLLVACLDESTGSVFGLSFGDCSLATLNQTGASVKNRLTSTYLRAGEPLPIEEGQPFQFALESGDTLLLFSDGVNECCYRDPHRSVQLSHIEQLYRKSQGIADLTRSLTDLALAGIEGNPGGQDNITVLGYQHP